jgi:hypothetical protein
MTRRLLLTAVLPLCVALLVVAASLAVPACGQSTFGSLRGVTRNTDGLPLPEVQVVVHSMDEEADRTVLSGKDGVFRVEHLKPGRYQLTASKAGFISLPVTAELAAGQSLQSDLTLSAGASSDPAVSPKAGPGGFFQRLFKAYGDDWKGLASSAAAPAKRGFPSPLTTPPYPFSDWPYGGSVDIGAPWTNSYPLMQALWSGPHGDAWKKSGIQIYGWLNFGFNVSTSNNKSAGKYTNFPEAYDTVANSVQPDQEVLYIERQPDTVQTDHFDWGFRFANLYGIDYRFTTAKGFFSNQLLGKNLEYGYDPVMAYVDLYWGQVADGMNIRIGRYISVPDIEAQLAPNNYTYSHSLLYSFDCYTQAGIEVTTKLNDHWLVQAGLSPGCDVAPWVLRDAKLTLNLGFQYTWNDGNDTVYPVLNALNDGKYAYNNLNSFYLTWYHKFRSHPSIHLSTEAWYMWEKDVPNVRNPAATPLLETNANGAFCNSTTERTCFAPEWAVLSYVEKEFSKKDYLTIRNEYFDDRKGQRTGTRTRYTEHLLMWGHWIGTTVLLRPELRFERAYDRPAYNNGTKKNQFTFGGDVVFFF